MRNDAPHGALMVFFPADRGSVKFVEIVDGEKNPPGDQPRGITFT
jgi:hypothetical protein